MACQPAVSRVSVKVGTFDWPKHPNPHDPQPLTWVAIPGLTIMRAACLENLVDPAVRVRGGTVLDVQQCLAQPHRRRAGAAVPYRPPGADLLDGSDGCDDGGRATSKDLADRAVSVTGLPLVDADPALLGA